VRFTAPLERRSRNQPAGQYGQTSDSGYSVISHLAHDIGGVCHRIAPDTLRNTQNPGGQRSLCVRKIGLDTIGAALTSICLLPMPIYAGSPEAIMRQMVTELGRLRLLCIVVLIAYLISARLVGPLGRKLLLGLALLIFFVAEGRSIIDTYRAGLYQRRKTMTLSDLQIVDNVYDSQWFSGKDVLPILVADYMPHAKVFLYDENLYSKELLGWSGRNPDKTFIVGGYQSTMDGSFRVACLGRPHILYKGRARVPLYIATPLSIYEKEEQVFLMKDGLMDYLIPGSWRVSQHE
jgi:hypothetical protein